MKKKQGKIMTLIEKGTKFVDEHQREIMLGSAIAGTILTAVAGWKAGIKADKILSEQREKLENNGKHKDNAIHGVSRMIKYEERILIEFP